MGGTMIIGVDTCRHDWRWVGFSKIKCKKCGKESFRHARTPGTDYCETCSKNH